MVRGDWRLDRVQIHPLARGRVGLSGPGMVPFATLSAAETATLPEGECCDSTSDDVEFPTFLCDYD
jgi:hypothetical protein